MTKKRHATKSPGVSYRLHATRRHGVNFDRYYSIRFQTKGQRLEEGVGWASEGWTEKKVAAVLAEIKNNATMGAGPRSLTEKRAEEENRRQKEKVKSELKSAILFTNIFKSYCKDNSHKVSLKDEQSYFKSWLKSSIGHMHLDEIELYHLDQIKRAMQDSGRRPRTINYIKSIIRQVYKYAIAHKLYSGEIPTMDFYNRQSVDNERQRYLTPEEAERLLTELKKRSDTLYQISLLSLYTGMRFGEIANLQWQHLNLPHRTLWIADPKNKSSRHVSLNDKVMAMFDTLQSGRPSDWVFPNQKGQRLGQISYSFKRAVNALQLNEGLTDDRLRVVFHTLRHTHATWLHKYGGAGIMVISRALGHKTLAMAARYTKVDEHDLRDAINKI